MCFPNTPASIKVLAAFCFCVNMFNLIYLFMRYQDLLPPDARLVKQEIEKVMPDVKNLDKYLTRRDGALFLGSLAGTSVMFDFILYVGVERQQPSLILSAWLWGVVDCSVDAAVGIASGNWTFMDLYRRMYGNTTAQQTTSTTIATDEGPRGNDTEYARGRKKPIYRKAHGSATVSHKMTKINATGGDRRTVHAPSQKVLVSGYESIAANSTAYRLTEEQTAVLVVYIILRLAFKLMALAGIKDYSSYVMTQRQRRQLEKRRDYEAQQTNIMDPSGVQTQDSMRGFSVPLPVMMPPGELAPMPPEPLAPPPGHVTPPPGPLPHPPGHLPPPQGPLPYPPGPVTPPPGPLPHPPGPLPHPPGHLPPPQGHLPPPQGPLPYPPGPMPHPPDPMPHPPGHLPPPQGPLAHPSGPMPYPPGSLPYPPGPLPHPPGLMPHVLPPAPLHGSAEANDALVPWSSPHP
ncbi:uncharacterized protein [Dermacentor albipictus]|uniref:uncharacterized protein isoform X2 n=1 Tax=Dermacentor albipictus TaxID=60249 RepID=UPI0031FC69BC